MRKFWMIAATPAVFLAACGQPQSQEMTADASYEVAIDGSADAPENQFGFFQAMAGDGSTGPVERVAAVDIEEASPTGNIAPVEPDAAVAAPQIAYRYTMGFRLPAAAMKPLQERHADMCEARGPNVCRIIAMRQSDNDGDYSYGSLQIAVASNVARDFSKELESSSGNSDAELITASIEGEDLSKQIVDTEAKLRARSLLRDRLMDILRNRDGTVAELVEAERGVAQVNQEIDQARSWLNEMRGRVAFSQMSISYESGSPRSGGFSAPIANAWGSLGAILGTIIAFMMMALTVVLPIGLIVFAAHRLWKWTRNLSARNGLSSQSHDDMEQDEASTESQSETA